MRGLNPWTQRLLAAKPRGKPPFIYIPLCSTQSAAEWNDLAENRPCIHSSVIIHRGGQEMIRKEYQEMDHWSDREVILEDEKCESPG